MTQRDLELPADLVDQGVVMRQPTLTRAIVVCADMAGFEDKRAAQAAGVDNATWSRIKAGQVNFPHDNFRRYQIKCGNWLPLQWLANDCGFSLVELETELERQLRIEQSARASVEAENAMLKKLLIGRAE